MREKKSLKLYQMLIGCILCLLITFSSVLPRVVFNPDEMLDDFADVVVDKGYDILASLSKSDIIVDGIEKLTKDKVKEAIRNNNDFFSEEEIGIPSFAILFLSKSALKDRIDDFVEDLELDLGIFQVDIEAGDIIDTEGISEALYSLVEQQMWKMRICLLCIYVLPLLLVVFLILSYLRKWNLIVTEIAGGCYLLLAGVSELYWKLGLKNALFSSLDDKLDSAMAFCLKKAEELISKITEQIPLGDAILETVTESLSDTFTPFFSGLKDAFRSMLKGSFGIGMLVVEILFLLFLVWLVLNLVLHSASKGAGQPEPVPFSGVLYIENGMLDGSNISLHFGEGIVVGANPAFAQLILPQARIAPSHCRILFVSPSEGYLIEMLMGACVLKSGGKEARLEAGQKRKVKKTGTIHLISDNGMMIKEAVHLL